MKLYEPLTFAILTFLILSGWGTAMWAGFEHIEKSCLASNAAVTDRGAQGPLRECK